MREMWRFIVPSRTIPRTRWRNEGSRWRTRPSTFVVLVCGLWLFGTGEALLVDSGLGNAPWTVLAQGISVRSGIPIGAATLLISVAVLLLWIPLTILLVIVSLRWAKGALLALEYRNSAREGRIKEPHP